ncbi:MAG TPA: exonuclease domain-containing protein [Candidatus Eremiobacteraceae bacterium]|nr:exonuclease domain-containing protein [Candidatus Eremiobacteraceae bacterium]
MAMYAPLPPPFEDALAEAAFSADAAQSALDLRRKELESTDLWDCPFAVVDIETTGGVAGRHAMTEIAVVRVEQGRIVKRWRSFVNPQQPIPRFVTHLTGITDEMVAGAPHVRDVLPAVVCHFGDAIVVGHNVRFDAGFIDFELRRHGHEGIGAPTLDTLALARRTIAEVANYKLGTLTRELGLDVERHHRALADATATAELLVHCIKRLEDSGVFTFGALQQYLRTRPIKRKRLPRVRAFGEISQLPVWTSALTTDLASVPSRPGVYLLKDAGGRVVYVGKSNCLRARIRAYATSAKPAGAKVRELRGVVASFDYLVTGSEFEALLLEAELVRAYDPPYNDRLRNFREFAFIKVGSGPRGHLCTTTRMAGDGARYYGPYSSMPAARAAVAALQDALGLRACDAEQPEMPVVPDGQYAALIDEAIAFIEGAADDVLLAIARRRDEAAARGRLEVAEREEARLDRLRRLRDRHTRLEFATGLSMLVLAPSNDPAEEACFLFNGGRLAAQVRLPRRLPNREEARRLLSQLLLEKYRPDEFDRSFARQEEIDQLFIVSAWFRRRREGLSYVPLPQQRPDEESAMRWAAEVLDGNAISAI